MKASVVIIVLRSSSDGRRTAEMMPTGIAIKSQRITAPVTSKIVGRQAVEDDLPHRLVVLEDAGAEVERAVDALFLVLIRRENAGDVAPNCSYLGSSSPSDSRICSTWSAMPCGPARSFAGSAVGKM